MHWIRTILIITLLYFVAVGYWFVAHHKAFGTAQEQTVTALPLSFKFRSAEALTSSEFPNFKAEQLRAGSDERALNITGLYFADEDNGAFPNLGELRGQAIAKLFEMHLNIEQLRVSSRRVEATAPSSDQAFAAAEFSWETISAPVPQIAPATAPLSFALNSDQALLGPDFLALKSSFGQGMPQQHFEISGIWYRNEQAAVGEDLGMLRAQKARQLFADVIAADRTMLRSVKLDEDAPASPFEATRMRWADALPSATASATPEFVVYFNSNEDTLTLDDTQAQNMAAFVLLAQNRRLLVAGHTDASGDVVKNRVLAQRRAEFLQAQLRRVGFTAEIVLNTVASEQPASNNQTAAGRRLNRRAVVTIAP